MNKKLLLIFMLLLTCFGMAKAEVVQIGTGESTTQDLPFSYYARTSRTQQIYEASEIGRSGYITSVSFFNKSNNECTRELKFYLTPTEKTTFSSAIDWVSEGDYPSVWVFSDEVTFKAQDWTRIEFYNPFYYDGTSNLILSCIDETGSISSGHVWFAADPATKKSIFTTGSNSSSFSSWRNTIEFEFLDWQVGSGEGTSDYLPTNTYYNYSLSQQIYTTDELGVPEYDTEITSVSFFNTGDTRTRNLDIYMVPTDKTSFDNNTDWIPYVQGNKVFSGEVTFKQGEWTAIGFNVSDYDYTGRKNIALIVDDNTGSYQYRVPFLAFEASNQAIYAYNDNIDFNADGLSEYAGTRPNVKNQIRFNDAGLDLKPYDLTVSNLTYNSAKISWKSLGGCWNLDYRVAGTDTWYHALDPDYGLFLWDMYYKLIGLDQGTTYEVRVRSVWDEESDIFSDYVYTQFTTPERFPTPTDLEVMYVTPYSAMLRWTENGDATKWTLSSYPLTYEADRNPFIVNGLTPGTSYRFAVRSAIVDEEEDEYYSNWSEEVSFTTPAVNPIPEISSVAPTPNSVTITWEGESEKYLVRCRKVGEEGEKLFFDDFEGRELSESKWKVYTKGDRPMFTIHGWFVGKMDDVNYVAAAYSFDWDEERALSADNWLVTKEPVELGGKLRFKLYGEDKCEVLLSTTDNAIDDFTTTLRPLQSGINEWTDEEFDLSEYEGQTGYIAIHHKDYNNSYIAIDDFGIYPKEWTIETTENSATIEGLEPNTEYEFEVIGIMNHQPDASSSVYTFMTLDTNPKPFDVVITPTATTAHVSWTGFGTSYNVDYREVHEGGERVVFYDDFENGIEDKGWTIYTYGDKLPSQEAGWYVATGSSLGVGSTSHVACSNSYYYDYNDDCEVSLNADNWLITPQVELGGTLRFKEWIRGDYPDSYEVRLSTTGKAKEDFTIVLRPLSTGANGWTDVELDLSAYEGQMGYIAIHHYCTYQFWLCIDNFGIYHNADEYGEWWTLIGLTETECTLEGLIPNTTYECRIVSDLDGNRVWTITNFTTLNELFDLVLDDNYDNTSILKTNEGAYVNATIQNRTFRKDGTWQGICLPFDVDVENSILAGADVRMLESEKQYLNAVIMNCLTPVTKMKAGTPYIIRWNSGADIVNPVFEGVVIDLEDRDVKLDGTYGLGAFNRHAGRSSSVVYSPFEDVSNEEYIFLMNGTSMLTQTGGGVARTIHAFDIMFSVQSIYTDGTIVLLNTGEPDELIDGITSIEGNEEETIYNVAGQRLAKKQRGINIVNGRKILIK